MITLVDAVIEAARRGPERPALFVDGRSHSYAELLEQASAVAATIDRIGATAGSQVAVHGERSFWVYAGLLGALISGRGYVPLNPNLPVARSTAMLRRAGAQVILAAGPDVDAAHALLAGEDEPLTLICPDRSGELSASDPSPHRVLTATDLAPGAGFSPPDIDPGQIAYVLFTSGTTGEPKGIGIPHSNVVAYLEATLDRYGIGPEDRCSQNFALTFDLSVHDLFVTWAAGACLCVPPPRSVVAPAAFVREQQLTAWFSTPTTAAMMSKLRMLRPGAFPSLRWSLFCGEALPASLADAWLQAAPSAQLDNLYGPTEATIACTAYRYPAGESPDEFVNGLVPIGQPYGRTRVAVVDEALRPVDDDEPGELLLGGPQLAPGYWRDAERTAESFVTAPALNPVGPWYRTGDRVSRNRDSDLVYHGRLDDQIKIRGHRVELGEVEAALRMAAGGASAIAVGWPTTAAGADGIVAFVAGGSLDEDTMLGALRRRLPDYMMPTRIHLLEAIPQNASGKVDRRRLIAVHEEAR